MVEAGMIAAEHQLTPVPKFNPQRALEVQQEISLMQSVIMQRMKRGVDYGRIPGIPQDSLWEPGASLIIASFKCYAGDRRIISLVDDDSKIAVSLEVPLISYDTGRVVATGIGAASTLETRHKYRWVREPAEWGYESTVGLKTDKRGNDIVYRIPNPEHGELLHNIMKQASKRAEMDAAENLPGVAGALREVLGRQPEAGGERQKWSRFWGEVRRLGYTDEQAHATLEVESMDAWLDAGHSLDDALTVLRERSPKPKSAGVPQRPAPPPNLEIKNTMALFSAAKQYFGMTQEAVLKDLNAGSAQEIGDAQEAWQTIVTVHTGPPPEEP